MIFVCFPVGDPLDPQADLREVEKVSCLVKPGGLFFLGFPFNSDAIMWNAHRIYGPIRLPMVRTLIENAFELMLL